MSYDLIVISSYPPQGQTHGIGTVGVASYTKNTLLSFPSTLNILVLAEKLSGESDIYQEKNIHVVRCWQRNSLSIFGDILKQSKKHPSTPVLIEFEMAMFGNPLLNVFLPLLLLVLKLGRHSITIVLHQVVTDFNEISGHIGQSKNSPLNGILNFLAKIFYKSIISLSSKIIVFEQFLKDRLDKNNPKIFIIPHGVEILDKTNNFDEANNFSEHSERVTRSGQPEGSEHRKNSFANQKDFVITIFGFLAWYKGTDWIVKTFSHYFDKHPKSKFKLIIAGGPNPNHLDKPYYQKYLAQINYFANKHPQKIIISGFVPESQIGTFYKNSDLILLPYRVGMSSSGPLSLAFTYHKPFLLSPKIAPILDTNDIRRIIDPSLVKFSLNSNSLFNKLIYFQKNPQSLKSLTTVSQYISNSRSWSNISHQYIKCLEL
ncbi:MAG: glycosyltransferase [Candidatus Shapirobacteria bacterium]